MKIQALNLLAFGPFTDVTLHLEQDSAGLHLIYGPNEAGKSSALRALRQMLYGIPVRSADAFIHPYTKLRIGGRLVHSSGEQLDIIRRKARGNTLRGADDAEVIEEARLQSFLGGVDEHLFTTLFGIDHPGLVKGGQEIIRGGGNIGQVLFSASTGISDFRTLLEDLQSEADDLFKPAAQKPVINALISSFNKTRKAVREHQLNAGEWETHDRNLREAQARRQETEKKLAEKTAEKNRLERMLEALPLISQRAEHLETCRALADAVLLPDDFGSRWRNVLEKRRIAEAEAAQAAASLKEVHKALRDTDPAENLFHLETTVRELIEEQGSVKKAARDRLRLQGLRSDMRTDARRILKDLGREMPLEEAEKLRLEKQRLVQIQELSTRHERLSALSETVRADIARLTLQADRLKNELASPPPPDASELRQVLEEVHRQGDLDTALQTLTAGRAALEKQVADGLKKLSAGAPGASGAPLENSGETAEDPRLDAITPEQLFSLQPPDEDTINEFEERLNQTRDILSRHTETVEEYSRRAIAIDADIRENELRGHVPTENELAEIRNRRDHAWKIIRQSWEGGDFSEAAFYSAVKDAGQHPNPPDAYENLVRQADDLADRLRREADRVARMAARYAEKEKCLRLLERAAQQQQMADADDRDVREKWETLWKNLQIPAGSPRQMRQWVRQWEMLNTRYGELQAQRESIRQHQERISRCRERLSRALKKTGQPCPDQGDGLNSLLVFCRRRLSDLENARNRRRQQENEYKTRSLELEEARAGRERILQDREDWQHRWTEAVRPLGLEPDVTPAQAGVVIEEIKTLLGRLKEAGTIDLRLQGIQRDADAFETKVSTLLSREAPDLLSRPAEQAVEALAGRIARALKQRTEQESLRKQAAREEKNLAQAFKKKAAEQVRIEILCREAGCSDENGLAEAENRSVLRKQMNEKRLQIEDRLRPLCAGAPLEAFINDALSADADTLSPRIQTLAEENEKLGLEKSQSDQTIGAEKEILKQMDGASRSAALAEEGESLLAEMEPAVEQWVRRRLAVLVLQLAMERYREKNQGPLLGRAGELFAELTLGAFEGLRPEFNDRNEGVLVGVRPGGRETVHAEGMSEGTADQLYLAVRLASLEAYLQKNEPMPFIVDDILIKFDDERAEAALKVLARLSRQTQVIFFTHHRHLTDLAASVLDPDLFQCHELGGASG